MCVCRLLITVDYLFKGGSGKGSKVVGLNILKSDNERATNEIPVLSQSLVNLGLLDEVLTKLADRIMADFIRQILTKPGTEIVPVEKVDSWMLSVAVTTNPPDRVVPSKALTEVGQLLTYLHQVLMSVEVVEVGGGGDKTESCSLMAVFGRICSQSLVEMLIRDCLDTAIPSRRSELVSCGEVISATKDLQQVMVKLGFTSPDDHALSDYVDSIDSLFAGKRCQELLEIARGLMTSDIHNIVKVRTAVAALYIPFPHE
jgi:hypothetical protein